MLFVPIFPLYPSLSSTSNSLQQCPPWFMSMGNAYKFFVYSISYTIFNTPWFILYLYFLIPAPFLPFSTFPLLADDPPNDLHVYYSISVLLVFLVCFLVSVVDSCGFIEILMCIVLIFFFFLNFKSL